MVVKLSTHEKNSLYGIKSRTMCGPITLCIASESLASIRVVPNRE